MADETHAMSWVRVLGSAGVIALLGRGIEGAFRWFIRRPLERAEVARATAERDRDHYRDLYAQVAGELKATHEALARVARADLIAAGAPPDSLPPPRAELPTLTCIAEGPPLRAWAEERERLAAAPPPPRRSPPPPPIRVVETYSVNARPTLPAPPDATPEHPVSLAPPMTAPRRPGIAPPRPERPRRPR